MHRVPSLRERGMRLPPGAARPVPQRRGILRGRRPAMTGTVYLLHFNRPYKHARHYVGWTARAVRCRLAEHEAGRGARLLAVVREAGIGWQLARLWPGGRARERQLKRQGGHARKCPLCGVTPRCLPRNADGSLSRSRTTDAQKFAAGVMTAAQLAEHTALRRGAACGKLPRPFECGPLAEDPWAARTACPILTGAQS